MSERGNNQSCKMDVNIFDLSGKISVITGGFGHLGRSMVEALLDFGSEVIIISRHQDELFSSNKNVKYLHGDICSDDSIDYCINEIRKCYSNVDILINNAYSIVGKTLYDSSTQEFNESLNGTVTSVFRLIQRMIPLMENRTPFSSIINIASMYGVVSPEPRNYLNFSDYENPPDYGVAKAGVIQLTKYCASKLSEKKIRVNCISPGAFPVQNEQNQEFITTLSKRIPLGRIGKPHEIQGALIYLASDASSFVTGHNLIVDGGWTIW